MFLTLTCFALLLVEGYSSVTLATPSLEETALNETIQVSVPMRGARFRFGISKDEIFFDTKVIPEDHQVTAFLYKGDTEIFFFENEKESGALVISVTPCTSSIEWSVRFRPQNRTGIGSNPEEELQKFRDSQQQTFRMNEARRGLFVVQVRPLDRESYVHLYVSRSEPLHEKDPHLDQAKLRFIAKQQRRRLNVRWEPSSVDPQLMHYCLVINSRRHYPSLCAANGDHYGVIPPDYPSRGGFDFPKDRQEALKSDLASKAARRQANTHHQPNFDDMIIRCVGKKTHFSMTGLPDGKLYYIDLFAVNKKTNMSFLYASAIFKYDGRAIKTKGLKDGKEQSVNFKQLDGLATFKFKVPNDTAETQFFLMPCGGGVYAEVMLGQQSVVKRTRIDSFGRLRIKNPKSGRYVLRVTAVDPEELRRVDKLQVMATSRYAGKWPELPAPSVIHEYRSLRTCDSLTIAWIPAPDPLASRYCLSVQEVPRSKQQIPFFRKPNQCQLNDSNALNGKAKQLPSHCFDLLYDPHRKTYLHKVSNLRPGRTYVIQVTVRRQRGKPLAYDLLQAVTKTTCVSE